LEKSHISLKKSRSFKKYASEKTHEKVIHLLPSLVFLLIWAVIQIISCVSIFNILFPVILTIVSTILYYICIYENYIWKQQYQYQKNRKQTPTNGPEFVKDNDDTYKIIYIIISCFAILGIVLYIFFTGKKLYFIEVVNLLSPFYTVAFFQVFWQGGIKRFP
jgi:hypothetical protein